MPAMAPERIGHYRIEDELGHGGMGKVYRAYDEHLERWVAIKLVRTGTESATSQERFRREARTAAGLDHPSIVRIHHVLQWEDQDCIVMEYVEGRTLTALLRDGPPDLVYVLGLAHEIADGLAAAHGQGVVHRDLKAENVMVTSAGRAKILDFGLAKQLQPKPDEVSLSADGRIVGTYHAMSPEQAQGEKVDHRSDLFSLGTLLYQLTTHQFPFHGANATETLAQVCLRRQTPARQLNPEVPAELSLARETAGPAPCTTLTGTSHGLEGLS
jgi:serine/threonine-protein kinase